MRKLRSPIRPSASRRSRVTPGVSSTSAILRPTRRLNSVDLPTLGRPTMATSALIFDLAAPCQGADAGEAAEADAGAEPAVDAAWDASVMDAVASLGAAEARADWSC